jgi:hypothetical protein
MDKGQSTMREVLALVAFASRPTAVEADSRQLMADGVQ